jgi:hypothetical protein
MANYRTDTFAHFCPGGGRAVYGLDLRFRASANVADEPLATPKANNKCPGEGILWHW